MGNRSIEQAIKWACDIANDNTHGYTQAKRWGPDYDCSSFVISALDAGGFAVKAGGATYTGNMGASLKLNGFFNVTKCVNLATGAGLIRGDILLKPYKHTELYIGNNQTAGAHISETGGKYGKTGDQTGEEISIQPYRNKGYSEVWRYAGIRDINTVALDVIRGRYGNGNTRKVNLRNLGFSDDDIKAIQATVNRILKGG